jgi:Carboxylesterase family
MAQLKWLFLAQIVCVLILGINGQAPSVTLDGLGELIGKEMTTINGRRIHAFQGIPYGESTAGSNRFQVFDFFKCDSFINLYFSFRLRFPSNGVGLWMQLNRVSPVCSLILE